MSRTPAPGTPGPAAPGAAPPKRPVAYPGPKPAATPAATSSAKPATTPTPAVPGTTVTPGGATAPAAGSASKTVSKSVSGPAAKGKPDYFSKRNLIIGGSSAGALLLLIVLFTWRPWDPAPPRLNEQPYKIAQFAATSAMDRLPWAQQREYMDVLNAKDEALVTAYKDGKLTDVQYRRALQLGWYDKHLDRMDKFFERPPQFRQQYIDEKVLGKKMKKAGMPVPGKNGKPKKEKDTEKSDDASPLKPEEIDRDDSTEEQDIKKWPADVRQKWLDYRAAVAQRKDAFKEMERQEKEKRKANPGANPPKSGAAAPATGTTGAAKDTSPSKDAGAESTPAGATDKATGAQ